MRYRDGADHDKQVNPIVPTLRKRENTQSSLEPEKNEWMQQVKRIGGVSERCERLREAR